MTSSDIGYLLNQATRRFRLGFAERLAGKGLRPQQAAALMALDRSADGCLTLGRLADAIGADAATTSGLLDRLGRDGWIEVIANPDDGRSRLAVLTPKAADALPWVQRCAGEVTHEALACLSDDEARTLERLLTRICEHGSHSTEDGEGR